MSRGTSRSTSPTREPRSTPYILASATASALILGLTVFLLVRGFQWRGALAALRAEPGLEILGVERAGFFKRRLLGLRDPLAPTAESILAKHNLGPGSVEVALTEYHSLNTPYARQREEAAREQRETWRSSVLAAVGEFAEEALRRREADLEKITRMLFEARFPEAMKTVQIEWRDGAWYARGELYAPQREAFAREAPSCLVEGTLDLTGLVDLTAHRTAELRSGIEAADLFAEDLDREPVHLERILRQVADYDEVCERSGLAKPVFRLELAGEGSAARERLAATRAILTAPGAIAPERFLQDRIVPGAPGAAPAASIRVLDLPPSD